MERSKQFEKYLVHKITRTGWLSEFKRKKEREVGGWRKLK